MGVLCLDLFVTGEKVWIDRGSNPGSFADRANTEPYPGYTRNIQGNIASYGNIDLSHFLALGKHTNQ